MRLPRDLSGHDLAKRLRRYGYEIVRQTGSHLQLKSNLRGTEHHVTVPAHKKLKLGTLSGIGSQSRFILRWIDQNSQRNFSVRNGREMSPNKIRIAVQKYVRF